MSGMSVAPAFADNGKVSSSLDETRILVNHLVAGTRSDLRMVKYTLPKDTPEENIGAIYTNDKGCESIAPLSAIARMGIASERIVNLSFIVYDAPNGYDDQSESHIVYDGQNDLKEYVAASFLDKKKVGYNQYTGVDDDGFTSHNLLGSSMLSDTGQRPEEKTTTAVRFNWRGDFNNITDNPLLDLSLNSSYDMDTYGGEIGGTGLNYLGNGAVQAKLTLFSNENAKKVGGSSLADDASDFIAHPAEFVEDNFTSVSNLCAYPHS